MSNKDSGVDRYISKSEEFAKPVLLKIREIVHKTCPEVEEKLKWGFPHFDYKGMMCGMAAFKKHCSFGFWKAALMKDDDKVFIKGENAGMGNFGKITGLKDLPTDKILVKYIKEAIKLNDDGIIVKKEPKPKVKKKELIIPEYFIKAVSKNKKALDTFFEFSNSHKKEYVEWVAGAKTETTRNSRLKTTVEWLKEGKIRNWKYVKCK